MISVLRRSVYRVDRCGANGAVSKLCRNWGFRSLDFSDPVPVGHEFVLRFPGSIGSLDLGLICCEFMRFTLPMPCRVLCLVPMKVGCSVLISKFDGVADSRVIRCQHARWEGAWR